MTLTNIIKGIREEFEKDICGIDSSKWEVSYELTPEQVKFKKFLMDSHIKLLEGVVEQINGEMFEDSAQAGQFAMHADGYNQALEEIKSSLLAEIENIKKLN